MIHRLFFNSHTRCCCVVLSVMLPYHSAFAINLNEALALSYTKNPQLEAERMALRSIDESMPQALSGWLPSISATFQRGMQYQDIGSTENNRITDTRRGEITQPLFKGGNTWFATKKAHYDILSARHKLRSTEQDTLLSAVIAYMDIVRDQEVLELNKNNKTILEKHLDATKERFQLGEVTRTDVAQAEASLAQALSEKIIAQGNLESSRAAYERVIGTAPTGVSMPTNPVVIKASLSHLITLAEENNPLVNMAKYDKLSAEKDISIKKSSLLPEVNLVGSKQRQKGSSLSAAETDTESVIFQVSVPLYQSGSEYSQIRQAKFSAYKHQFDLDEQINKVREDTIRAYQDFQVAKASITSNNSSVEAFQSALEGTEHEAKVGARTTLDVLDAEQDLFVAKANLIRSKRDEIVAAYTVLAHIGRLNASELGLNVTTYDPKVNYEKVKYKIIGF